MIGFILVGIPLALLLWAGVVITRAENAQIHRHTWGPPPTPEWKFSGRSLTEREQEVADSLQERFDAAVKEWSYPICDHPQSGQLYSSHGCFHDEQFRRMYGDLSYPLMMARMKDLPVDDRGLKGFA